MKKLGIVIILAIIIIALLPIQTTFASSPNDGDYNADGYVNYIDLVDAYKDGSMGDFNKVRNTLSDSDDLEHQIHSLFLVKIRFENQITMLQHTIDCYKEWLENHPQPGYQYLQEIIDEMSIQIQEIQEQLNVINGILKHLNTGNRNLDTDGNGFINAYDLIAAYKDGDMGKFNKIVNRDIQNNTLKYTVLNLRICQLIAQLNMLNTEYRIELYEYHLANIPDSPEWNEVRIQIQAIINGLKEEFENYQDEHNIIGAILERLENRTHNPNI